MKLNRTLTMSLLISLYAAGCTDDGNNSKDNNASQTQDACSKIITPSCDENNGFLKSCVNNELERIQCTEQQICDPTLGCIDKTIEVTCQTSCSGDKWIKTCSDDTSNELTCLDNQTCDVEKGCVDKPIVQEVTCQTTCNENVWTKTCSDGSSETKSCDVETENCDVTAQCVAKPQPTIDVFKCLDETTLQLCIDNECITEDCSKNKNGKTICQESLLSNGETTADCVAPPIDWTTSCQNNILMLSDGVETVEIEDCTISASICDAQNEKCVPTTHFTCNGTVLTVNDGAQAYQFDCSENTDDNIACNPSHGCDAAYCVGSSLYYCEAGKGCSISYNCAMSGMTCSNDTYSCTETCDPATTKLTCDGNTAISCKDGGLKYEYCDQDLMRCDANRGGCYVDPCTPEQDNTFLCDNNELLYCMEGYFYLDQSCENLTCDANAGKCVEAKESWRCLNEKTVELCIGAECITEACAENSVCKESNDKDGNKTADCVTSSSPDTCNVATHKVTCNGNTATLCTNGKLTTYNCEDDFARCDASKGGCYTLPCTAAQEDTYLCDSNDLLLCMYGFYALDTSCGTLTCDAAAGKCK